MNRISPINALLLLSLIPLASTAASEETWSLEQNDPNPYCSLYAISTQIDFTAGDVAHVLLAVWNPDSTEAVRTLFDDVVVPGSFSVFWDGKDDAEEFVPAGEYPYVLTATELGGAAVLFESSLVAEVSCCCSPTTELQTWAQVKNNYRN